MLGISKQQNKSIKKVTSKISNEIQISKCQFFFAKLTSKCSTTYTQWMKNTCSYSYFETLQCIEQIKNYERIVYTINEKK